MIKTDFWRNDQNWFLTKRSSTFWPFLTRLGIFLITKNTSKQCFIIPVHLIDKFIDCVQDKKVHRRSKLEKNLRVQIVFCYVSFGSAKLFFRVWNTTLSDQCLVDDDFLLKDCRQLKWQKSIWLKYVWYLENFGVHNSGRLTQRNMQKKKSLKSIFKFFTIDAHRVVLWGLCWIKFCKNFVIKM